MLLMRKLLVAVAVTMLLIVSQGCSRTSEDTAVDDKALMKFIETQVIKNDDVKLENVTIVEKKKIDGLSGWEVWFVNMTLRYNNQEITAPEKFFVKDNAITPLLFSLKDGTDFRDINPTISNKLYDKEHLIAGDADAAHKVVVFSDPLCPYCQEIVPRLIQDVKANPSAIALYYYHLPLEQIHPASVTLAKVMEFAHKQGRDDIVLNMYGLQIDPATTDEAQILQAIKQQLNYSVSSAEINSQEIIQTLKNDKDTGLKMMVTGTPTIFIDGKLDKTRDGYKEFLQKK